MTKKRKYYTLLEMLPGEKWAPQFGDYDRNVVKNEERDMRHSGSFVRGTKFTIAVSDGTKAHLDSIVEAANKLLDVLILEDDECREIARGAIERHLGDVCTGDDSADSIYDEAYTIAFDALHDKGATNEQAQTIAREVAQAIAQP